jgi:hypothetical protein
MVVPQLDSGVPAATVLSVKEQCRVMGFDVEMASLNYIRPTSLSSKQ